MLDYFCKKFLKALFPLLPGMYHIWGSQGLKYTYGKKAPIPPPSIPPRSTVTSTPPVKPGPVKASEPAPAAVVAPMTALEATVTPPPATLSPSAVPFTATAVDDSAQDDVQDEDALQYV